MCDQRSSDYWLNFIAPNWNSAVFVYRPVCGMFHQYKSHNTSKVITDTVLHWVLMFKTAKDEGPSAVENRK